MNQISRKQIFIVSLFLAAMTCTAVGCGETNSTAVPASSGISATEGDAGTESSEESPENSETEQTAAGTLADGSDTGEASEVFFKDIVKTGEMGLQYATEYQVEEYGDYRTITIPEDDQEFLLIPEGAVVPEDLPDGMQVLQQPLDKTYLVSTSVMDYICTIGALDNIRFSGTKEENWTIPEAQEAMDLGYIQYAGKYNAPDYEQILAGNCNFAIENTMIYHNPDVREKLMDLGIPVMVERSSYERNPLGRLEWIRLYGVLYDKEEEADSWYQNEIGQLEPILQEENTGKTVAFFSVTSNGSVTIRKPGDYISKMIEMAGGKYIFTSVDGEDDNALSTMNMQMEEFYATAKDADILIYNSTIEGEISSVSDLVAKDGLFADFKAVQNGDVYCTGKNLFQEPTGMGEFLKELHEVFTGEDSGDLQYLTKVTDN